MKLVNKYMMRLAILLLLAGSLPVSAAVEAPTKISGTRDIISEIIDVIGLKPRFQLRAANIDNAAAVIYNGERYILYNEQFLEEINNAVHTDWAGVSILAHEIGHHLNGHTLSRSGSNPEDELEADEFSGFVLRKMGASLEEAQAAINLLAEERTSRTHPGRSYRLAAISKGWQNAESQLMAGTKRSQPKEQPVARNTVKKAEPARNQVYAKQQRAQLDSRYVLRKVTFNGAPDAQFYLTTKLHLVQVTSDGLKIIGKLARTNSREFPYYFESDYIEPVFVSDSGVLVNKRGQKVGYFS
ncbi:membrane-binding protein [Pontibacter vulgaris]|uniref:membrane-binding protein n=1 Tax=Pontibacter vulgaris TaxID=2905679 RepID=UPI001FA7C96B|nr:membrane-binding protein [Pontibacter vulgaris]